MSDKPWEKRGVWCSDKNLPGWLDVLERDNDRVQITITDKSGFEKSIVMKRCEAKTFAAILMNLAGRDRS